MDLTELFCSVDDFTKIISKNKQFKITYEKSRRGGPAMMSLSEIMTIIIAYHSCGFKNFKAFYLYLLRERRKDFPKMLSYSRFVEWIPYALFPLCAYLKSRRGKVTGISFVDSTSISVCKNIRIPRNKVFKTLAMRGKTSMGWFFGFKLHIIVNDVGELIAFKVTRGNTNDRVPLKELCKHIRGKLFGDKGYLGQKLFEELFETGVTLITNVTSKMKNRFLEWEDKVLLRKRFVIETINDQLKNIADIEHSRHRSPTNFLVNLIAGLVSYTHQSKKPSIRYTTGQILQGN